MTEVAAETTTAEATPAHFTSSEKTITFGELVHLPEETIKEAQGVIQMGFMIVILVIAGLAWGIGKIL